MEDYSLDLSEETPVIVEKESVEIVDKKSKKKTSKQTDTFINPLKKKRIIVRYLAKPSGIWGSDSKHVLSGGMADTAVRTFVVPKLQSGHYVNILTDSEKRFFENILGLEDNALSIYTKVNNFWSDANPDGINKVKLKKQDNYFDLSNPEDYIKYKILLANKNVICPSIKDLEDRRKATYQFVIIDADDSAVEAKTKMTYTMECYKEFGKIEEDADKLKVIIETIDGRPISANSKLDFLQTKCNELIQHDAKLFLRVIKDDMLDTKVLIKKSVEAGNIVKRGNYYYLRNSNETIPLCENNEEPTFTIAAKYLNAPKHQEVMLSLQAKIQ